MAVDEGVAVGADDLIYGLESGVVVPMFTGVRKVFVSDNIIIASAQLISARLGNPVVLEYQFKDWISEFIRRQRGAPDKHPNAIAAAMYQKARQTFKPIEVMLEHGAWDNQGPGDRIVSYVVAGYPKTFVDFHLFELGAEVNADGKGLQYLPPRRNPSKVPQAFWLGEDANIEKAMAGVEPFVGVRKRHWDDCVTRVCSLLPGTPSALQDAVASVASLIKLEAQFNPQKVGATANIALIDRTCKKVFSVTL